MRITLDALLVLDAVDRAGSFAAGAESLSRVPSAVSYTIQKLEQDLGVAVFNRSGHRAKLTTAGAQLLKEGRELLRLAEQIEQRVRKIGAGWEAHLSIAVGDLIPLGAVYKLLRMFADAPGHQSTHLDILTNARSTSWMQLLEGRADLLIGAPERSITTEDIRTRILGEMELVLAVPPMHPLADAPEPIARQTLMRYRLIRHAESPIDECSPVMNSVTVDDYASQVEAIRHNLGIGYVPPCLMQGDVAGGRMVAKAVADAPRLRLIVAWRASRVGHGLQWVLDQLAGDGMRAQFVQNVSHTPAAGDLAGGWPMHSGRGRELVGHELRGSNELEVGSPG
jgi:DNA-binding transcriptional LysR family regulator